MVTAVGDAGLFGYDGNKVVLGDQECVVQQRENALSIPFTQGTWRYVWSGLTTVLFMQAISSARRLSNDRDN